jgi:tetratricopeptide (TPR) repeat protein/serine/threonine protein kinase
MKLVQGKSFARSLSGHRQLALQKRQSFDPTPYLKHLVRVCETVSFAHSRGVIHRDLKPANLMVGAFGEVLVMDWGLARKTRESENNPEKTSTKFLSGLPNDPLRTVEGSVQGTPSYMAPEQARGEVNEVDEQSDVYSLGAVLYEILTGTPPHIGTPMKILSLVCQGKLERPRKRAPEANIPLELEAVILKAMSPEKKDRYQNVNRFQADIQAYLDGRTLQAAHYSPLQKVSKWIGRNRKVCATASAILLIGAGLLGVDRWREENRREENFRNALSSARQSTAGLKHLEHLATQKPIFDQNTGAEFQDLPEDRKNREAAIQAHLTSIRHLERALQIYPKDKTALHQRIAIGTALGDLALAGRDYMLAQAAYQRLTDFGLSKTRAAALTERINTARQGRSRWRRDRLETILEDLTLGLSRPGRPRGAPLLNDYVFEAASYRDAQTIKILAAQLENLTRKTQSPKRKRSWSNPERDLATFLCRVLGRIGLPECIDPLGKWLAHLQDPPLAIEAGLALCNTRRPEAGRHLFAARDRVGIHSFIWKQIRVFLARIPSAPAEQKTTTAKELFELGLMHKDKGNYSQAIKAYTQAIDRYPRLAEAYTNRALIHSINGELDKALHDYNEAILQQPNRADFYTSRGILFSKLGDSNAAFDDYNKALEIEPRNGFAYYNRGRELRKSKKLDAAIRDFAQAIKLAPKFSLAHKMLGITFGEKGDLESTIRSLSNAIRINPNDAKAYNLRGDVLRKTNEVDAAIRDYNKAIEIDPNSAATYSNLGSVFAARREFDAAIKSYSMAIEVDPNSTLAYSNRGASFFGKGKFDAAIADFNQSLRLAPHTWQAWYGIGQVRSQQNRHAQALDALDKALSLAPKNWKSKITQKIIRLQNR